ncbi:succinylglutamate desuccinylase/aspartoacylase family protein [Ensifer sp. HO-A22]|uniref:Succinylglutamate desuccinylase/aspartoacylase family protein n=1 Tax=Ensifer oleiphilus TaxID=2742698 RepID=A0A7Y6UQF4_9HYPH|nr:M14 family metallopeptidase [Ensifer oleiphilus]NVD41954.1 succinylglutamate desuccinylase/aspartoacylase family protein [Ensifer oleiphilus]
MMKETIFDIEGQGPGTRHRLKCVEFGSNEGSPIVYIQGGLHADEAPGIIVAHALCETLAELEAASAISGRVRVVPVANPVGLSQFALGQQEGRFDLYDGRNFNRHYPDFGPMLSGRLSGRLGNDASINAAVIRAELKLLIDEWDVVTPSDHVRKCLMNLAIDADYVLDLHCDGEAEVHLYTQPLFAQTFSSLATRLQARAVLLAEISGLNPFDEALVRPWLDLARELPDMNIPLGCASTTVELRGRSDVDRQRARSDAEGIVDFLRELGIVKGSAGQAPAKLCEPTPLAGSEAVVSPSAGVVSYAIDLGQEVIAGDVVAEIIDPLSGTVTAVKARTSGVFYARADSRIAERGKRLGKIAGKEMFRNGPLLSP